MNAAIESTRRSPENLLEQIRTQEQKANRGKLKIFFGSCAGVGKTYAMLSAAREQIVEGADVVVGVVETHSRPETERLLEKLPVLPPTDIAYKGVTIKEFDLDAALKRKPEIILVDEFAHTNAPGSRHPKRWNDVEELLDAGISVYTTLNVQHIESLSDLVAGTTGIFVKETIPDSVFDAADDIVLIDLNADDLLKRLREGKVYIGEIARARAADHFFRKGNLIALRELALRRTAERIDAQRNEYDLSEGVRDRTPVADKIMVCIGPDALSAKLVRTAKRMAASIKSPWVAVYVENTRHYRLNERGHRALQAIFRLVERIGGKVVVLQGENVADEIINYAQAHRITKIIIGKPIKPTFQVLLDGTLCDRIINKSGDIDIYVVTSAFNARTQPIYGQNKLRTSRPEHFIWSLLAIAIATSVGILLRGVVSGADQGLIYLTGVVFVAARFGLGPALFYAFLSSICLDFFFIEPLYSFSIYDRSYWTTMFVIVITGFVIANQASRLRRQTLISREREQSTQTLYTLTKELSSIRGDKKITEATAKQIADALNVEVTVWLSHGEGQLEPIYGSLLESDAKEKAAIMWCFDNEKPSGLGTNTMPTAVGFYLPLLSSIGASGVLGVITRKPERIFSPEEMALLETFANLLAASLERVKAAEMAEHSMVEAESERLRNALLSSVSHDLRTPLASITGASSSLAMDAEKLSPATTKELANSILKEASRLSRIVANLLDITTLEAGRVKLNFQPYFIQEMIGSALSSTKTVRANHPLQTNIPEDLPMVLADGALIEQVIQNLLENAAHHTPPQSIITISVSEKDQELMVSVADQGPGIPSGEEGKIFDKFYTLSRHGERKGSGLGLAICASIMRAHGQRIWVENQSQGGAKFSFSLSIVDPSVLELPHDSDI
jgi:two-component system sensor histidine kinase KdpD